MKLIVGLTGASGVIYGVRLLEELKQREMKTHLVLTELAKKILTHELGIEEVASLATQQYDNQDLESPITSGSYEIDGMVIVPCSMKTLSGVAHGYAENLILRAADVTLKERRPLVLVPRETPLNIIHLENMLKAAKAGAIIVPAMPSYYHKPKNIDDLVNYVIGKILDVLEIPHSLYRKWGSEVG